MDEISKEHRNISMLLVVIKKVSSGRAPSANLRVGFQFETVLQRPPHSAAAQHSPMVEIVKKLVEQVALVESGLFGNQFVIRIVELAPETSKHTGNAQIILMVSVERCGVEYH